MNRKKVRKGIDWFEDKINARKGKTFRLVIFGDYEKFEWEEGYLPDEFYNDFEKAKERADKLFENNPPYFFCNSNRR